MIDYYMSEKFGLDWKEHDNKRMVVFIEIMRLKSEREHRDAERSNNKGYGR